MRRVGMYLRELPRSRKGTGEYTRRLVEALLRSAPADLSYVLVVPGGEATTRALGARFASAEVIALPAAHRVVQDQILAPRILNRLGVDVAWFPKNMMPRGLRARSVVTVHDYAYFVPELQAYPWLDRLYITRMLRRTARRADAIVAISAQTREDSMRFTRARASRIHVISHGVGEEFRPERDPAERARVRDRYGLEEPFLLVLGDASPRKNVSRLLRAFARVQDRIPHRLVVAGKAIDPQGLAREISGVGPRVMNVGPIASEDLPALYTLADGYLHPSLYEGFGMTILEAQASGLPVLNSDLGCMREVGGDACLYVDPESEDALERGLIRLASDEPLRQELRKGGLENASCYTWAETARRMEAVFRAV